MRVVVLAPIVSSPFALAVTGLCLREPGVEVAGILVLRHWNVARLRRELRRDGARLLRKVWQKLVLRGGPEAGGPERSFHDVADELELGTRSLAGLARRHHIPYRAVPDHNHPGAVAWLRERAPHVVAFTGGGLVRRPLLEAAGRGILNAHMGLLPAYRGMDVVEWPILEGRHASVGLGVTLHFMDPGIDTGPVVAVRRVPIRPGDGIERLRTRFEPVMVEAMLDGIRGLRDGALCATPQERAAGRQYFALHPRLQERVRARLAALGAGDPHSPV